MSAHQKIHFYSRGCSLFDFWYELHALQTSLYLQPLSR